MNSNQSPATNKDLEFALDIAREAGALALDYFERGVSASSKSDGSPVTEADKQCERIIREAIAQQYPSDNILGEEHGETIRAHGNNNDASTNGDPAVRRKWIIDPIDGTYNFVRQIPIFATLLALEENGEIVLGVVNAPAAGPVGGAFYWASKGGGAYKNGKPIAVSQISDMAGAHFLFGEPDKLTGATFLHGLLDTIKGTRRQRAFCDYLNFAYVFEGKAEAAIEVGVKPWDLAPMKILAEEAGGRYSDLEGGTSIYTGNCLVTNGLLHDELLGHLSPAGLKRVCQQ